MTRSISYWHPSQRNAQIDIEDDHAALLLRGWSSTWEDWRDEVREVGLPVRHIDTLRVLAVDWCAHGVSPCEATTRVGVPLRGVDVDEDWVRFMRRHALDKLRSPVWWARHGDEYIVHSAMVDERAKVREARRG